MGIGFIGLAECLVALTGKHHGEDAASQELGLKIVSYIRNRANQFSEEYQHNYSVLATPAEGLSGKFTRRDRKKFGSLPGITDRDYYTNSNHVPVYYKCSARHKAEVEAPYHEMTRGGHIFYVEMDGDATHNPEVIMQVVDMMDRYNIGYGSVNHNRNRCLDCGYENAETHLEKCPKCGSTHLTQDPDTLDTWFSSALWPFSTLGWPEKTPEFDYFYPTDVLVTGYDIIFFWVIRMVFSALEQTKQVPFHHVLIHGLVRDSQGRKMSKSLGNGIDPLEVIDKYGADALRLTLMTGNAPGNDMRFYWERVEASRNFANKVWNASRFIMMNLEKAEVPSKMPKDKLTLADKWILSKVNTLATEVTDNMDRYELGIAVQKVYDFIWEEFCDWYIEMVKPRLYSETDETKGAALWTLKTVLGNALKLLHPFMPFITEEIYCLSLIHI